MKNADWPWLPLGDLFEIGAGKTMSRAAREGRGKIPFLRTSNVLWDEIDLSQLDEMAMTPEEVAEKCVEKGDLLVCEGGEIGRAAIWDHDLAPIAFQNHLHRLRARVEDVEPRFYAYFLQSAFTQLGIYEGAGNKTTIPNLSRSRLAALKVPHPPKAEQEVVARSLRIVRAALRGHVRSTELAVELKGAVMRELFTRGLLSEPQKETEIGSVPDSWAVVRMHDICQLNTGTTPATKRRDYYQGEVAFIKTAEIINNRIRAATTFISKQAVADYNLTIYPRGTILMAMYGQGKTRGQVSLMEIPAATTQNAAAIQPSAAVDATFLWHFLLNSYDYLRSIGALGHVSHLNLGYLRDFLIPVPQLDEQRNIAAILDAIDRKIDLHRHKQALFEELFKSLLHKLMTGEIRVFDLDFSALPALAEITP
jgi:type I restriction enzyme S subunit